MVVDGCFPIVGDLGGHRPLAFALHLGERLREGDSLRLAGIPAFADDPEVEQRGFPSLRQRDQGHGPSPTLVRVPRIEIRWSHVAEPLALIRSASPWRPSRMS